MGPTYAMEAGRSDIPESLVLFGFICWQEKSTGLEQPNVKPGIHLPPKSSACRAEKAVLSSRIMCTGMLATAENRPLSVKAA